METLFVLGVKIEPFKSESPFFKYFPIILTFQHIFFWEKNIKASKEN